MSTFPRKAPNRVNIRNLFLGLQEQLEAALRTAGRNIRHGPTQGNVTEAGWRAMLDLHLPHRYTVGSGFVVDAGGATSQQIDLIIFDQQYCPLVFHANDVKYVAAESVYAVFEIKPKLNAEYVGEAIEKAESVRRLKRTSVDITSAAGRHPAFKPKPILAGILAFDTDWSPPLGTSLHRALDAASVRGRLDLGCCLRKGAFNVEYGSGRRATLATSEADSALISFFMTLLHRLQPLGTVTALDLTAYGNVTLGKRHATRRASRF
jgi:hypothetical protein